MTGDQVPTVLVPFSQITYGLTPLLFVYPTALHVHVVIEPIVVFTVANNRVRQRGTRAAGQ